MLKSLIKNRLFIGIVCLAMLAGVTSCNEKQAKRSAGSPSLAPVSSGTLGSRGSNPAVTSSTGSSSWSTYASTPTGSSANPKPLTSGDTENSWWDDHWKTTLITTGVVTGGLLLATGLGKLGVWGGMKDMFTGLGKAVISPFGGMLEKGKEIKEEYDVKNQLWNSESDYKAVQKYCNDGLAEIKSKEECSSNDCSQLTGLSATGPPDYVPPMNGNIMTPKQVKTYCNEYLKDNDKTTFNRSYEQETGWTDRWFSKSF